MEVAFERAFHHGPHTTTTPAWPIPKHYERLLIANSGHVVAELARDLDGLLSGRDRRRRSSARH